MVRTIRSVQDAAGRRSVHDAEERASVHDAAGRPSVHDADGRESVHDARGRIESVHDAALAPAGAASARTRATNAAAETFRRAQGPYWEGPSLLI